MLIMPLPLAYLIGLIIVVSIAAECRRNPAPTSACNVTLMKL
jgi:hypothetical protein